MKHNYPLLFLALATFTLSSCKKDKSGDSKSPELTGKIAPDGFTYATSKQVKINVRLLTNNNQPIKGVVLSLFTTASNSSISGNAIFKAVSDANGDVKGILTIPSYIDTLVIEPNYIGLLSHAKAVIVNNSLDAIIGGSKGYFGNVIPQKLPLRSISKSATTVRSAFQGINYLYPGNGTAATATVQPNGRPTYLESTGDVITSGLLALVNSSLPEYQRVPQAHPEFLSDQATSTLNIISETDIYVTFVSEGAGYLNGIGFYTYPTNTPPATAAEAGDVTFIFPNASGGLANGLVSGDKVNIGHFNAGTSIGFVLFQDAWRFNSATNNYDVNLTGTKLYSHNILNPEPSPENRRHTVLLHNVPNQLFVLGFEDVERQLADGTLTPYCDNDFNDLVLFASTEGVSTVGLVPTPPTINDCDNDGVLDAADAFPCDPKKAYISYFPSENTYGTLAFEDNWPKKGDYDMNDLVVNYRYEMISNASNNVVEMNGNFVPKAAGAKFKNGFGVQFPFSTSDVSQVTGQKSIGSYIQFAGNGLEAGQTKAVIVPFDNHLALIKNPGNEDFINTDESLNKIQGDTAKVHIKFTSPISQTTLGNAPFNPFLIVNQLRGYEVHLPGFTPTDKATTSLFGTADDHSNPATGVYYLSSINEPWALSLLVPFEYPIEEKRIDLAFPHFMEWVASGGSLYDDWYSNLASGYRNNQYKYSK